MVNIYEENNSTPKELELMVQEDPPIYLPWRISYSLSLYIPLVNEFATL